MHHKRDPKHFNELIQWAKKSRSRAGRKNVEALSRKEPAIKVFANELARFLHKEFFTFKPEFKPWIAGNHKPGLRGTDHGIQRRVKLIPITSTIPQEKRIPFEEMKASQLAEASGIINWALECLKLFCEDGYWKPEDVSAATREYFSENDLIGQFFDEACELDKSGIARITRKELYAHFSTYSEENGLRPMSNVKFLRLISERGFDEIKSAGERYWIGIRKACPAAPPEEDRDSLKSRQYLKFAKNSSISKNLRGHYENDI